MICRLRANLHLYGIVEGNIVNYITQIRGVSYKPSDLHDSLNENSIILLRANNIDEGKINFEDVVYVDKSKVSETQILRENDILICASSGSKNLVGKAASFNGNIECTFGAFCKVIRPRNIFGSYLSAFFQSKYYRFHISQFANGANINNIKNEHINSFSIPERSFEEQKEISYKVSSLNRIIESYNRELDLLDELIKARFVEMFGDVQDAKKHSDKQLKDICNTVTGGTPSTKHAEYYNGTIPWISTVSLGPNYIDGTTAKAFITQEAVDNSATKIIPSGSILFGTRVGVGKSSINQVEMCTNQDIVAIIDLDESKYNKLYIKYVLDTYQSYFDSIKKGATILGISSDDLKNIYIPAASLYEQNRFEKFVKQIDKSRLLSNHSLFLIKSIIF